MAIERVAKRVSEGGHNIPKDIIIRRYWLGLKNFFNIFVPIVDSWMFFDNVDDTVPVANNTKILNNDLFFKIKESCLNKRN